MAGKKDGRQLRWDSHNQARRQHILDAAIAVFSETPAGAEVKVQQIAERAGLSRTVVYRHFADRADLDRAVQARALELLRAELLPALSFEGTPVQIVRRIVSAYVGWAAAHPSIHEFAQADPPGAAPGQMEQAVEQIAGQIEALFHIGVEVLGVSLVEEETAALDPLVFGLVGGVFTSTRRWLSRPEAGPSQETFVTLLTQATWLQIAGMASERGVVLDPDVPVEELLGQLDGQLDGALDGAAG